MNLILVPLLLAGHLGTATVLDTAALKNIANITYAADVKPGSLPSIFSPRMDFEQWKPLTGRGDPLRNDPTYDYEPPVLERVHYWADDTRLEPPPHKPERKSEVLVLGVSSRRPSLTPRQPPRHHHRPQPSHKYEDYSYKLGDHYPMTILVPPPPPPPGQKPPLYLLTDEKLTTPHKVKITEVATEDPTHLTSLYALQEANLIYQSSTVSQNWVQNNNQSGGFSDNAVSSDYAGWGPTTPIDDDDANNETQNYIFNEQYEVSKHPYSFYRPMLSEAPPPPQHTPNPLLLPNFLPTALPMLPTTKSTPVSPTYLHTIRNLVPTTTETLDTEALDYSYITTEQNAIFQPTPISSVNTKPETTIFDMLRPMMSMPLSNGPERTKDHLYALASETQHVFKDHKPMNDVAKLESMQTMQPPPPSRTTESTSPTHVDPFRINANVFNTILHKDTFKNNMIRKDPNLQSRLTTPMPTVASIIDTFENIKSTTESPITPMYLIIQGHSKVKTYSSKSKPNAGPKDTIDNEIPKQKGTQQVKHLHPIKEKYNSKKVDKSDMDRTKYVRNLKGLIADGIGTIDIQETDVGIKYDISDGSDVPVEIYKKGIVETDENDYSAYKKKGKRTKRQLDLLDLLPFNEESIEEYVYNYLNGKKNETGITGLIAKAVTSDAAEAVDELEEDDEDDDEDR